MTADELRAAFLKFFEAKGHQVMPSASLIPYGDPTLLLTSAGMVPFKPYYLGEKIPDNPRMASCQKCFRTTDIESVGDRHHLTFFEMLGNFSIGDYFKKEAISWGWEFVTQYLKLPPSRLWITIFLDDDESFEYWREIGVSEGRILRLGEEDNFWGPAGNSGPCGPCSEIHFDLGEGFGCRQPSCGPGCDCDRFSEIWNLVFTQYNQDEAGNRTPLPKPNIDTGMGLERIAAVVQGKNSVYETDLFAPLLALIADMAGKAYGDVEEVDNAMRVVAEHARSLTFLIGDGVMPDNEGRGYVLRRLLRRGALFSRRLGANKPFLTEVALAVIRNMGETYPEITQREDFIIKVIESEEKRFSETLTTGLKLLDDVMEDTRRKSLNKISGKEAFRLYDTYGFPIELTAEIVTKAGLAVDTAQFEAEMEKQRKRARAAHKFELNKKKSKDKIPATLRQKEQTSFTGYDNLGGKSKVSELLVDEQPVDSLDTGQEASLILETTPFYAEMGGQVGDTGEVLGPSGRFLVTNTVQVPPGIVVHLGKVIEGTLSLNEEAEAIVDKARRLDIARNHTATHLLQLALREVLGEHVHQRGSLVTPERLRFDFSHLEALSAEEIRKTADSVNDKIRANLPVYYETMPYQKAIDEGATALFDEKYGDAVRVVKIGKRAISAELCGGTHVNATGEIGFFSIISEGSIGAGLRRIEALTGRGAEKHFVEQSGSLHNIAEQLGASISDVPKKISGLISDLEKEKRRAMSLETELSGKIAADLLNRVETINGIKVLSARVPDYRLDTIRGISDSIREQLKSVIIVLGTIQGDRPFFLAAVTPDLVEKGYNAGDIIKRVAEIAGGKGGGKANFAQAGGKFKDKLDEALNLVKSLV